MTKCKQDRIAPTAEQRKAGEEAIAWFLSKPDPSPPKLNLKAENGVAKVGPEYDDLEGFSCRYAKAFGTHSKVLLDAFIRHALISTGKDPVANPETSAMKAREAAAFVASLNPQSEIETTMGLQMWATHCATMHLSENFNATKTREGLADYNRMMNQTARTFMAQAEALAKLRSGGKQRIEVRYVYVDARTQTLVPGEGGGVPIPNPYQPHAPGTAGLPFAPGLPVWGENTGRDAVPVASDPGPQAMPDARGPQSRRSQGKGQRQLRLRTLDGRDHTGPGDSPGTGEALSEDAA